MKEAQFPDLGRWGGSLFFWLLLYQSLMQEGSHLLLKKGIEVTITLYSFFFLFFFNIIIVSENLVNLLFND